MKQKQFLSFLLCGVLLSGLVTGCEKTPEKPIVREKGAQSTDSYKEADAAREDGSNELSKRLQIPERYEASQTSNDGNFQLSCQADIFVPDVAQVPIYKVGQKPLDDEWISQVTKAFFGDATIYDGEKYFQKSKAEALERLNELKAYQAEGNLDPYNLIGAAREQGMENPEQYYNLQEDIASWEQIYNEAPEEPAKTEITPGFGMQEEYADFAGGYFTGAVELDDAVYHYRIRTTEASPMDIRISRMEPKNSVLPHWEVSFFYDDTIDLSGSNRPSREKAAEIAGITPEEAIEIADQYMEKLGLSNFSAKSTSLVLCASGDDSLAYLNDTPIYCNAGYMVSYTRDVDGFPITDEMVPGGGVESMESTIIPWLYENITFYVNQDGLQQAEILNLYQIEEEQVSNTELLSFPEIADIFEEMASIKYSSFTDSGSIKVNVSDVTLGYMRIYEPSADNSHGLLVPVWDFFGDGDIHVNVGYEGEPYDYTIGGDRQSLLTINGADGTVVDRGLGY